MQSQISDLRDKLTDACPRKLFPSSDARFFQTSASRRARSQKIRYTEIANMKKTKSHFEQEVTGAPPGARFAV